MYRVLYRVLEHLMYRVFYVFVLYCIVFCILYCDSLVCGMGSRPGAALSGISARAEGLIRSSPLSATARSALIAVVSSGEESRAVAIFLALWCSGISKSLESRYPHTRLATPTGG